MEYEFLGSDFGEQDLSENPDQAMTPDQTVDWGSAFEGLLTDENRKKLEEKILFDFLNLIAPDLKSFGIVVLPDLKSNGFHIIQGIGSRANSTWSAYGQILKNLTSQFPPLQNLI